MALDFTQIIDDFHLLIADHDLGDGNYSRFSRRSQPDASHVANPYGCADASNLLYTLGALPRDPDARARMVAAMQRFQDPHSGAFQEPTHSKYHTTAHVVAALELYDARPRHRLTFLEPLIAPGAIEEFLDGLNWDTPWRSSHDGAGSAVALALTEMVGPDWLDRYFAWLDAQVSPETGMWRRDRMMPLDEVPGFFGNLGGTFHYHFNYLYFRVPIPHPEKVIDSCLTILESAATTLGVDSVGFKEIDWAFCINRALRESGHRRGEVQEALREMAERVHRVLSSDDYRHCEDFDDLHQAFGALCAVAELQLALPGQIRTPQPLRLVLDRRPFI